MLVMGRCIEVLRFVGAEDHHLASHKTSANMPPGPDVLLASMTTQQSRAEVSVSCYRRRRRRCKFLVCDVTGEREAEVDVLSL